MLRRLDPHQLLLARARLGSGCGLQQLAGGAFELEPLVVVRQRAGMRGGGDGRVPQGLDRPAFLGLVDRLQSQDQRLAKAFCQELVEIGLDSLGPGVFDRLQYRLGAALRIFAKTGVTSSSQRSGAALVWRMRISVYWSAPQTYRFEQT
jgi:hypothetical protein